MDNSIKNKSPDSDNLISYYDIDDIKNNKENLIINIDEWDQQLDLLNSLFEDDDDDMVIFSTPED